MVKNLHLLNQFVNLSSSSRRQSILNEMTTLMSKGISCHQCSGPCCTYKSNSMQITVLEAVDIIQFLNSENRINADLVLQLEENIAQFRLSQWLGTGKTNLRKTYTCPFFENTIKGCSISRNSKPIGCLAFNPVEPNITDGGSCKSNLSLLLARESEFHSSETEINTKLKLSLNLYWAKAPIPVAIIDVLNALEKL